MILQQVEEHRGFLGTFSIKGIEFILNKFKFIEQLKSIGFPKPIIELDTSDPYKHRIQIVHQNKNTQILLAEIVMRRSTFKTPSLEGKEYPPADLIVVEWFMLQNPIKKFSRRRPQLPGQDYPGLGVSSIVFEIFYWMAKRLESDGIVIVPNYLHTGIFYGRRFVFVDPNKQGIITAFDKMRSPILSLNQLSLACAEGQLINKSQDSIFLWKPAPMMMPVSRLSIEYFGSEPFLKTVRIAQNKANFKINSNYKKEFDSNWKSK